MVVLAMLVEGAACGFSGQGSGATGDDAGSDATLDSAGSSGGDANGSSSGKKDGGSGNGSSSSATSSSSSGGSSAGSASSSGGNSASSSSSGAGSSSGGSCPCQGQPLFCAGHVANCGQVTGTDNCGATCTVDCGTCNDGHACHQHQCIDCCGLQGCSNMNLSCVSGDNGKSVACFGGTCIQDNGCAMNNGCTCCPPM